MSNPNTNLVTIFNDHFVEFLTDVHNVFPNDTDILTAKNSLVAIRKANPKLIVRIWLKYVANPYQDRILAGDTEFFIEKDYSNDLTMSTTAGGFSKRNVKNLLLDRDNDRTPFLSEIKTQESNGWETFQYSNTSRSSANFYSVIMRKPMN